MKSNNNIVNYKLLFFILVSSIIALTFVFSPAITIYVVVLLIALLHIKNVNSYFGLLLLLLFLWLVSNAIDVTSYVNFLYKSDDFSTYYNNYLGFVFNQRQQNDIFEFGPIEFGLPVLNYILAFVLQSPEPYKVKFLYSLLQGGGLLICAYKIARYYKLDSKEFGLLVFLIIIFYKPLLAIQLSRQCYSTIFIVLYCFSRGSTSKISFALLAIVFHTSAIFLLPISVYLFKARTKKDFYLSFCIILSLFVSVEVFLYFLQSSLINIPVLNKLDFAVRAYNDDEKKQQAIITSLLLIAYLMPLIFTLLVSGSNMPYRYNIYIMTLVLIVFCAYPGFNNRVFFAQLYFLLGYYYFMIFFYKNSKNIILKKMFMLMCFTFLFMQSHLKISNEEQRLDFFNLTPFHYLENLSESGGYIDRDKLEPK